MTLRLHGRSPNLAVTSTLREQRSTPINMRRTGYAPRLGSRRRASEFIRFSVLLGVMMLLLLPLNLVLLGLLSKDTLRRSHFVKAATL